MSDTKRYTVEIKTRNWLAVEAHLRGGAGSHKGSKREQDKRHCRKFDLRREEW